MLEICGVNEHTGEKSQIGLCFMSFCDDAHFWNAALFEIPQYASEDAELLLVGNKLDCETDREISRQQGEKVRETKVTILGSFPLVKVIPNMPFSFTLKNLGDN